MGDRRGCSRHRAGYIHLRHAASGHFEASYDDEEESFDSCRLRYGLDVSPSAILNVRLLLRFRC